MLCDGIENGAKTNDEGIKKMSSMMSLFDTSFHYMQPLPIWLPKRHWRLLLSFRFAALPSSDGRPNCFLPLCSNQRQASRFDW